MQKRSQNKAKKEQVNFCHAFICKYQQKFELNLHEDFLIQAKLYPKPNYIPSRLFPNNA